MINPVIIVPYDPAWPAVFGQIRDEIVRALGATALEIEHIGSTSVAGLAAKPIIDMDVVIPTEADLSVAISKLSQIGYTYDGERALVGVTPLFSRAGCRRITSTYVSGQPRTRAAYSFSRLPARQSRRGENIRASQEASCRQVRL
ncbi:GrpB family protein [Aminobacter anthyllidis]|uniref:GrpB family protein n=1 Tax=Aminobacter anthyllidis TaxID=1035067 RepID=A0A9X1AGG1_9HYPH|nr:GrpB family protein [Aminobacter anthyllidis]MBT1159505.1 GrpB family protein [Aminobacter anthyllidis]